MAARRMMEEYALARLTAMARSRLKEEQIKRNGEKEPFIQDGEVEAHA